MDYKEKITEIMLKHMPYTNPTINTPVRDALQEMAEWKNKEQKSKELYDRPKNGIRDDESITSRLDNVPEELKLIANFIIDYAHWNLHKDECNHPIAEVPLFRVLDALINNGKNYKECSHVSDNKK